MKTVIDRKKITFYFWVALAFLLLWLFSVMFKNPETFPERALNNVWRLVYVFILNIILFEFTIPFIGRKRKSIIYNILIAIPIIFVFMMLYSFGLYAWRLFGIYLHIYTPFPSPTGKEVLVSDQMSYSMMSVFFFGVIRHVYGYIELKNAAQQLRLEKQEAELNYLKAQTNPHFLFNTLNNIYSLARDKSDLAPESILRLSKILRFMLYETSGSFISIEKELKIITDYIELEKLRYDESLRINFNHDIEDMKQSIPPLLLIPLVENAFKHGVSEARGQPFIDIHLSVNNRQLVFVVKNSAEDFPAGQTIKKNIGLSNLRRQLELLYKDFSLSAGHKNEVFIANLKINLATHV